MSRSDLPTGTVTFLFSDIEGSTRLLGQLGERYTATLEDHHRLLREAFASAGGVEVLTEGDAFFIVFAVAGNAVRAAVEAQRALAVHDWPPDGRVRVRIGLHTGEGTIGAGSYVGLDVHRAARISAAGHGGQILVSEATRALAASSAGVSFRDLGPHRLKDLPEPEHLYQVVAGGLEQDFPPVRAVDAKRGNLPAHLTSFVGRRHEVEAVKDLLRRTRLITLTGPGGTGKTRLSLQVATEMREDWDDGAYFVALAPILDPSLVAPTLARALGLREEPGRRPIETVIERLRDSCTLIVCDNFEQVLDAASDVAELLAATERVTVVVTSRERLNLVGEFEYAVPPLALPDRRHLPPLEVLSQYEAVALFVERARAVRPGFEVTNDNAPSVAEICARLDGLPLAIELAAARAKILAPEAILSRLEHRLSLLAGGARDLPARQQTLRQAIAWSYDLLEDADGAFFARLAVFAGGATLESIEAVCADPDADAFDALERVASLTNKSLLRQIESPNVDPRFLMLETIREFAAERLAASGEDDAVRRRHAEHFFDLAENTAPDLFGPKQAGLLDALEQDHDNFRAALVWSAAAGEVGMALRLGAALWRFWQMRGHLREAAERLAALTALPGADGEPDALAMALEAAGGVSYWTGRWDESERCYSRCLEIRRRLGDGRAVAEALYNLSFVFTVPPPPRRDARRGAALNEEAMALFGGLGDRRGMAKTLWALSTIYEVTDEWERSLQAGRQALELFVELDDRFGAGWAYHAVGVAATQLRDFGQADRMLADGLRLFASVGDITGVALLLGDFAMLEGERGDCTRASRLYGASLAAEQRSGQALVSNQTSFLPNFVERIRGGLSKAEHERLVNEGAAMVTDDAVAYALGDRDAIT